MATTKIIPEVLDLRGGLPDFSLAATNTVSYLNAGGGNQYNFNGAYGLYGVVNGTYVLSSVSSSHPIAILNNGKTSLISYTGAVNEGSQTGPDGNTYTYYSGDVTITVSGNFDVVSYACKVHGYMGGQNNLIYTNLHSDLGLKIPTGTNNNRPATDVAGMIRNNTNETSNNSASCEEYYNGTAWQKINNIALPPEKVFQTINWTGTAAEKTISFANSPDLVIIKNMDENSNSDPWYWFDSTRGATKYLQSASDAAEGTDAQTLKSFTSTGFVLGTNDAVNGSGHNTYGIGFRVNGGTTSSNTDGTITSTVQVNNQTGMSIVQWTGDGNASSTVGHGLSSAPTLIILKDTSNTRDWQVYATAAEAGYKYGANLNLNNGFNASAGTNGAFDDPSATVINFSNGSSSINNLNASGASIIAYCFVETSNYFASRRYTGSGSSGSPSINFGFKPDFVIIKSITQAEQWWTAMSATNSSDQWTKWMPLQSNERLQNDTNYSITVDANGFSPFGTPPLNNQSGIAYLALGFKINS